MIHRSTTSSLRHALPHGSTRSGFGTRALLAAALGAAYYFLEPRQGARHRAVLRDKLTSSARRSARSAEKIGRNLRNHAQGWMAEIRPRHDSEPVSDDTLVARVRSRMGQVVSNAHSIAVSSHRGHIRLTGTVPASEHRRLVRAARAVAGVTDVTDQLTVVGESSSWLPAGLPVVNGGTWAAGAASALLALGARRFLPFGRTTSLLGMAALGRRAFGGRHRTTSMGRHGLSGLIRH